MMNQFYVRNTVLGRALFVVDTSRYDLFHGFGRIVKYL